MDRDCDPFRLSRLGIRDDGGRGPRAHDERPGLEVTWIDGQPDDESPLGRDDPRLGTRPNAAGGIVLGDALASAGVRGSGTTGLSIVGDTTPGQFTLAVLHEDGSIATTKGTLRTVLAAMDAALVGVDHIDELNVPRGRPVTLPVNRPSLDVVLTIRDRACGSTLNVALRKAIRVDITGCRSTITAQVDDNVGDDDHPATIQIFGSDSEHVDRHRAFFIGPVALPDHVVVIPHTSMSTATPRHTPAQHGTDVHADHLDLDARCPQVGQGLLVDQPDVLERAAALWVLAYKCLSGAVEGIRRGSVRDEDGFPFADERAPLDVKGPDLVRTEVRSRDHAVGTCRAAAVLEFTARCDQGREHEHEPHHRPRLRSSSATTIDSN